MKRRIICLILALMLLLSACAKPIPTGWVEETTGRQYFDEEGVPAAGWLTLEGKTYHFDSDNLMQTGCRS